MMGSPTVFQIAPPHPESKARITCPAVFAGGPDASQNGLGLLIPAKSVLRSATIVLLRFRSAPSLRVRLVPCGLFNPRTDAARRPHPLRHRVNDFFAAI